MVMSDIQFFCHVVHFDWNCWGRVVDFFLCYKSYYSWHHPWRYTRVSFLCCLHPWIWCLFLSLSCGVLMWHSFTKLIQSGWNLLRPTTPSIMSISRFFSRLLVCFLMFPLNFVTLHDVCHSMLQTLHMTLGFVMLLLNIMLRYKI